LVAETQGMPRLTRPLYLGSKYGGCQGESKRDLFEMELIVWTGEKVKQPMMETSAICFDSAFIASCRTATRVANPAAGLIG